MKYCPQCSHPLAAKEIRGRKRLTCDACGYVFYNNPTPVVAAIVEREAMVLLVSKKEWGPGWGVLSGGTAWALCDWLRMQGASKHSSGRQK